MSENYYCDFRQRGCQYSSTFKSNAKKHSKNECGLVSANPEYFKNHVENCLGIIQSRHQCDVCNQMFTTMQKLRNHKS